MSYMLPVAVVNAQVALVAGAANVTIQTGPGVGLGYRAVAVSINIGRTATGIADIVLVDIVPSVVVARASGLSVGGVPGAYILLPEPGYQFADNSGMQMQTACTVATGTAFITVYFFTDPLT